MSEHHFDIPIHKLPVVYLQGSYYEMGRQFGKECRNQINELCHIRTQASLEHAAERGRTFTESQALELIKSCSSHLLKFDENIYQETLGIAEGANLTLEQIMLMQGLTDYRDYLSWAKIPEGYGCTSMIISRERSKNGKLLLAQNWDLGTSNMPYVCFVIRHPNNAPKSYNLTVAGGLSLIGMNSKGLAIGTNNIKTTDTQPGLHYLNLIHKAMQYSSADQVKKMISRAIRSGAHYFLFGDKQGNFYGLECSATKHDEIKHKAGVLTHCNHILSSKLKSLEAEDMGLSTCHRQIRVNQLTETDSFDLQRIKEILSDHDGDELSICRHSDHTGISTNASVILEPEDGLVHACRSHPHSAEWQTFKVF